MSRRAGRLEILARGGLYLVLTEPRVPHATLARAAVERGVPALQLREKTLPDDELVALARTLRHVAADTGTLFIVNDRADVAAEVGADGVHVGRADMDPLSARAIVGPNAIVGLSANTVDEVAAARAAGADYVGVGPVFPTATKPDASEPVGLEGLRTIAAAGPGLPVVAIGGLDAGNAADVLRAGADFVAVVSAVCFADDPLVALDELLSSIQPGG
jgi:thiamine-phosphate diphosphorylase